MKIEVDWPLCDGNGVCAIEAPEHFELDDDDQLQVLQDEVTEADRDTVERAIEGCPKHALSLQD